MARSILKFEQEGGSRGCRRFVFWMVAAWAMLLPGSVWAQGQAVVCSSESLASVPDESRQQVKDAQQTVEAGVFYQELLHRFDKPESCRAKLDGTNVALTYVFHHGARLEAKFDSTIEYSEQDLELRGLDMDAALALLKKGAADAFGDDGCGLDWSQSKDDADGKEPEMHSVVYRGSSCNCQAKINFRKKAVVGLTLSSAC